MYPIFETKTKTNTVSIIGTAGRRGDAHKVDGKCFTAMVEAARLIIQDVFKLKPGNVELVSGGAAVADHVAVAMFIEGKRWEGKDKEQTFGRAHLHLPAKWDNGQFAGTGSRNDGSMSNFLHKQFSRDIDENSLKDIETARLLGAKLTAHNGFFARNAIVAESDYIIAFTWGNSSAHPKPGGTKDTWDKAKKNGTLAKNMVHIRLDKLVELGPRKMVDALLSPVS